MESSGWLSLKRQKILLSYKMTKEKRKYSLNHLNPREIIDRGTPITIIAFVSLIVLLAGLAVPAFRMLVWMGGLTLFFIFLPVGVWLYIKLK